MAECPRVALADSTLPPMARILLAVLWSYAGREKRFVWPSIATLSQQTGLSTRSAHRNLKILRERRWVIPAESQGGRPGWHLCDPPGVPVRVAYEAAEGSPHPDASVTNTDASVTAPASEMTPASPDADASVDRLSIGTNHEPIKVEVSSPIIAEGAKASAELPPPPGREVSVNAWRSDFVFRWRAELDAAKCGHRISDPTSGAHRLVELQRMLDEHGGEVVSDVLIHAGHSVARNHDTNDRHGLHPRMLAVTFRADKPQAFDALLDAWQRDTKRKRVSGKLSAPPVELDGVTLNDDDQRVWMTAMGHDSEQAVRDSRAARQADGDAARMLDECVGSFGAVAGGSE